MCVVALTKDESPEKYLVTELILRLFRHNADLFLGFVFFLFFPPLLPQEFVKKKVKIQSKTERYVIMVAIKECCVIITYEMYSYLDTFKSKT